MARSLIDDIPLQVLICDASSGPAITLEQSLKQANAVIGVRSVGKLEDARTALQDKSPNTIFIDPLAFNIDYAHHLSFRRVNCCDIDTEERDDSKAE